MASPAVAVADEAGKAPARKKSPKLLIIVAAAVLLVGGGAAFFFMRGGEAKATAAKTDKAPAAPKGPAIYVGLEPPFVVNFEGSDNVRFLQIAVQVMTRDPHTAEVVKSNDPVIRNDLLLLFGNQKSLDLSNVDGKEKLRQAALDTVRKVVAAEGSEGKDGAKPGEVEAVYFTSFVMQ